VPHFDDPFQAIRYMIDANLYGLSFKEIACLIFPTCSVRTAENKLNRALNPDNHDIHYDVEWVELVMEITGREDILHYWLEKRVYDPNRLHEIRRPTKDQRVLLEEISAKLDAREQENKVIREQLKLALQEPGGKARRR